MTVQEEGAAILVTVTVGELHTYYATVAQVIPVLALALIIEGRIVARRFASAKKKKLFRAQRRARLRWGVSLAVVTALFMFSEYAAISTLVVVAATPIRPVDYVSVVVSASAILLGLLLTFSQPLTRVIAPAIWELRLIARVRNPFGQVKRFRREARHYAAGYDAMVLQARDQVLRTMITGTGALLNTYKIESMERQVRAALANNGAQLDRQARAAVDEHLRELARVYRKSITTYEESVELVQEGRRQIERISLARARLVEADKRLSKWIRNGHTGKGLQAIRRALSDAAKER